MKLYLEDNPSYGSSSFVLWGSKDFTNAKFFVYGYDDKGRADAVALKDLWEGLSIAVVFADWLEERGHKAAADDLRRNF